MMGNVASSGHFAFFHRTWMQAGKNQTWRTVNVTQDGAIPNRRTQNEELVPQHMDIENHAGPHDRVTPPASSTTFTTIMPNSMERVYR